MKKLFVLLVVLVAVYIIGQKTHFFPPAFQLPNFSSVKLSPTKAPSTQQVIYEESVITMVVENALPSVVTVAISKTTTNITYQINPFDPFGSLQQKPGQSKKIEQNIGSGFVVENGYIITNKHVVSDISAKYKITTNDGKTYPIDKIYRDPLNDLAILKVNDLNVKGLILADSAKLKLGQMAIAIGTPLGQFQNTITTGIVSGLSRGITAGSPFEGFVEKLDNVIQTSAAISPGNSGGPLLNSSGQVIGVNTAVSTEGQNIGFAIPANVIRELIDNFNRRGGTFERPYIGIRYEMIDKATALTNKVAEGAWVREVIEKSPAAKADIQVDDILTEFGGQIVTGNDSQTLAKMILSKKIGEVTEIKVWRDGKTLNKQISLEAYSE